MIATRRRGHAAVFRAISDPTRREILGLLRGGARSVGDIAENFRITRPAISRHIRVLRSAGLVTARRDGTTNICELNVRPLRAVSEWLEDYESLWTDSLRNLKSHVEGKS